MIFSTVKKYSDKVYTILNEYLQKSLLTSRNQYIELPYAIHFNGGKDVTTLKYQYFQLAIM